MIQPTNRHQNIQKLYLLLRAGKSVNKWKKETKKSKQRSNILKQWLDTQTSYINDLKIIQNHIQKPFKQKSLINDQQQKILFPNINSMVNLSQNMAKCLQKTLGDWNCHTAMIGQKLLIFHKFFLIYRQYCNNFMKGQDILKQLKKDAKVIQIQSKLKLDIQSYTIKPVQRPPKYQLLLRQYLKCLYISHPDYVHISEAIQKYKEVNQLNNQSMDHQIRVQTMIKLDKKYGNIISNRFSRQYLSQYTAVHYQVKAMLYLFSDMLLVVHHQEQKQIIYKKIYFNNTSFVHPRYNLKYFKNMIYVCGMNQSIHLEFQSYADSMLFAERVDQVISKLIKKEEEKVRLYKQKSQKNQKAVKLNMMAWKNEMKNQVDYKINLKIRVKSSIKPDAQPFYFIQFKTILPYNLIQSIGFSYQNILDIQNYILDHYRQFYLPKIDVSPQLINLVDIAKNRTKLIEYRSFVIQEFLNYVFRNDQFHGLWLTIGKRLGLQTQFMKFATFTQFDCSCSLCQGLAEGKQLKYYYHLIEHLRHAVKEGKKTYSLQQKEQSLDSLISMRQKYKSQIVVANIAKQQSNCTSYYFKILKNIRLCNKSLQDNLLQRLSALEAELGRINYHLINAKEVSIEKQKPINYTIKIHLLSIDQEYIEFTLKKDMYVREILEDIAFKNSLKVIFDWGLYLEYQGQFTRIDNDQKLIQLGRKLSLRIEGIEQISNEQSILLQTLQQIKKWGEQIFKPKRYRLFMKKHFYLESGLELEACISNKQRYHFFINEILAKVKHMRLMFNDHQLKQLCSLYLLRKELQKMKFCTVDNIDTNPLKQLLPQEYYDRLTDFQFRYSLVEEIHKNIGRLSLKKIERNSVQTIYIKLFELYKGNKAWMTSFYKMERYKTQGDQREVLIGINYQQCSVMNRQTRQIMNRVSLQSLKYRVTTFSLFLEFDRVQHRFQGKDMWNMIQLIQAYLAYNKMYRKL